MRFNNLIQMHLSTYSEVLFNVEYQVQGFLGISICPVRMISKGETWVDLLMSIFVCAHQSFFNIYMYIHIYEGAALVPLAINGSEYPLSRFALGDGASRCLYFRILETSSSTPASYDIVSRYDQYPPSHWITI